jgi:hypothetical protein
MTRPLVVGLLCAVSAAIAQPPPESEGVTARSKALDLAGAFANDGYKTRDGFWEARIEPGKPLALAVNLFSGNEYWFSAAALPPGRKLGVAVFTADGKPVECQYFHDGPAAAAGFEPEISGKYFVQLRLEEGESTEFCLVYSYK